MLRPASLLLLFAGLLMTCPLRGQAQEIDDVLDRAQAEQSAGQYAKAAADYAQATTLDPETPELWANRGVMEYLAGEMDASVESLKHALLLNPKLFTPLLFTGKAYLELGKPELALPYLNHAHSLRPEDVEVLLSLGKASEALHQHRTAASAYADAAALAPDNAGAWFGLGVASLGIIEIDGRDLASSQAQSVWSHALYADELFAQGRPVEALDAYKAASAAATPQEAATLARTVEQMQLHPDLFSLPPTSQQPLQRLSEQLKAQQRKAAPAACPSTELESHMPPGSAATVLLSNAACAYWAGDYQRSAATAGQALLQYPQNTEARYWSVKANERRAVASLARFEELAPQSPMTYDLVGDLYRHQRQPDSALAEYNKALAIDVHDPAAQLGAAAVYLSLGNAEQAASLAQAGLADRPLDPPLNLLMAESLVARNEFASATPYLEKSLAGPAELLSRVHALLGRVDAADGRTAEAIQQYVLALPSDDDGSLHYQLARLYRKTGDIADAQKAEVAARALIDQRLANATVAIREITASTP